MEAVEFIARAEGDGGAFGLHRGGGASTGVAGDGQQIVGGGEFWIPLEHGAQIEHHVGQALDVSVCRLGGAKAENGNVVAQPHVALIEGRGIASFVGSVGEFAMLDVVPGENAVGEGVADGVGGKLSESAIIAWRSWLLLGFELFCRRRWELRPARAKSSVRRRGARGCGIALQRKRRARQPRAEAWK